MEQIQRNELRRKNDQSVEFEIVIHIADHLTEFANDQARYIPRAVIVEVDGRKLAASMTLYPQEQDTIANKGITGHFDVYFGDSIRHIDGKKDPSHQAQVERAAGLR